MNDESADLAPAEAPESSDLDAAVEDSSVEESAEPRRKKKRRSLFAELPVLVAVALALAVVVKTLAFQAFYIPSESMVDTLQVNDRILVNKLSYRFGEPQRGDVVVFDQTPDESESLVGALLRNLAESVGARTPEADLIKRVVGLPGETIEISNNTVFIDGEPLNESYLAPTTRTRWDNRDALVIPEGEYFVMGDNRTRSLDSRRFGPITRDEIIGRAFVIIWPTSRWDGL